jgi:hypothetical protein
MSNLSTAEVTAGISHKALAALKKPNGKNGDTPHETKESPREPFSGLRETRIIDTPSRCLSILETRTGEIILRNLELVGSKCSASLIQLEREQTRTLALALIKLVHQEN